MKKDTACNKQWWIFRNLTGKFVLSLSVCHFILVKDDHKNVLSLRLKKNPAQKILLFLWLSESEKDYSLPIYLSILF